MQIYLVQHGKSRPKEEDPEQSLSPEGMADVRRIAETAGNYGVPVLTVLHSGKKRAVQTAEIMAEHLKAEQGVREGENLKPMDNVHSWADKAAGLDRVMLVGHLPFMERLASLLVAGKPDIRVIRFQNGGIVCLEQVDGAWHIKWTLMPRIG